ncbi:MAG: hypothetical protein GXO62_03275 [Epsilonproteobacteria bacterium]|nr:hypothetical protein [Campylobacterota bacterium]
MSALDVSKNGKWKMENGECKMQIILNVDDRYVNVVMDIIKSLKDEMINSVELKNEDLVYFDKIVQNSKNKQKLTEDIAINTEDMIDDIF